MSLNKFEVIQSIPKRETSVVTNLFAQLADVQRTAPEYFAYFEDADPDTAGRAELVELMVNAPNDQLKYFLFGKFTSRLALAAATGREFL